MFARLKRLPEFEKFYGRYVKGARRNLRNLVVGSHDCKQAISLSDGVYCGVWREKVSEAMCRRCPYFDLEPAEYKRLKRT